MGVRDLLEHGCTGWRDIQVFCRGIVIPKVAISDENIPIQRYQALEGSICVVRKQ